MAAIDYLKERGLTARVDGKRIRVSPAGQITDDVRAHIKAHRLEIIAELAANDGETRRAAWDVLIPGYGKRRMIGEPCTHSEATAHARGIWPEAEVIE
jgi:hypothetical protein